jgi:hypothetical protein
VVVQVSVHFDKLLLRDTVIWDVSQPYTTPEQYASSLCDELGLRFNWYSAIHAHVQQLLLDVREVWSYGTFCCCLGIKDVAVGLDGIPNC